MCEQYGSKNHSLELDTLLDRHRVLLKACNLVLVQQVHDELLAWGKCGRSELQIENSNLTAEERLRG